MRASVTFMNGPCIPQDVVDEQHVDLPADDPRMMTYVSRLLGVVGAFNCGKLKPPPAGWDRIRIYIGEDA